MSITNKLVICPVFLTPEGSIYIMVFRRLPSQSTLHHCISTTSQRRHPGYTHIKYYQVFSSVRYVMPLVFCWPFFNGAQRRIRTLNLKFIPFKMNDFGIELQRGFCGTMANGRVPKRMRQLPLFQRSWWWGKKGLMIFLVRLAIWMQRKRENI